MRRSLAVGLLSSLLLAPVLWAAKVEKEAKKLDKELRKVSLTAADIDGRRVVNRVMAKQLGIGRKQLVNERRETGFVYGQLFGAHEVARLAGLTFSEVARQMKQHQSLLAISQQHEADLSQILSGARKLNKEIDKELDRVANGEEDEQDEDAADSYDPADDSITADSAEFSPAERAQAANEVHHRGAPFGQGGPYGGGLGAGSVEGSGRAPAAGVGGGPGGGHGRGRH